MAKAVNKSKRKAPGKNTTPLNDKENKKEINGRNDEPKNKKTKTIIPKEKEQKTSDRPKKKIKKNTPKKEIQDEEAKSEDKVMIVDVSDESKQTNKDDAAKPSKKRKAADDGSEKPLKLEQLTKKARKIERKKSDRNNFDLSTKVKKIWETVRSEKCPDEKRELMLNELSNLIKGKAKELIFAHDTVRVIEYLVAQGTSVHRDKLFEELKGEIIALSKSTYSKFFVLKMLKYGSREQKDIIMKELQGKIIKLIKHSEAASIVESAYNECANAVQRSAMMEEFYGPKFALFKDADIKTLSDVLAKQPNEKDQVLKFLKDSLLSLIEKSVVKHSIVHHALREFITHATDSDRSELIEASREIAVQVLHTKDGSRFAMNCLWHGTPKDRKAIIKTMKSTVKKVCEEEEGHMVLLALFDCVDDTKIVEKIIIQEIAQNIRSIADNVHGRKVLQYLLSPRDSHFFHPDVVNLLKQGDGNKFSKKDTEVRRKELLDASSKMMLDFVQDRADELIKSNLHCLLILATLQHASGDLENCHKAISKCFTEPYQPATEDYCHMIEQPSGGIFLKKVIQLDKEKHQKNEKNLFLTTLLEELPKGSLSAWINCNRGAFHLLLMLETEIPNIVKHVKKELSSSKKALGKLKYKGAQLLLAKL